jgi:4-hydroxybenzoate polyprenyltransferase
MRSITPALHLLRPHQWLKNLFVFAGLLFGHAWQSPERLTQALTAFVAFCLLASAVYVLNDLIDRDADRLHPRKKHRPLAAGTLSLHTARLIGIVCLSAGCALALAHDSHAPWVFFAYLALNIAYSFWLKHIVILDVVAISAGFLLRLLAGTLGLGIAPSHWLLLCGLLLTLFLGFAKRRAELDALSIDPDTSGAEHRRVLAHYSAALLDPLITLSAIGTVIAYALYTISPDTVAQHGSRALLATVPCVMLALWRYLSRLRSGLGSSDAARDFLSDTPLMLVAMIWLTLIIVIIH